MSRRMECKGPGEGDPCPAHGWWYVRPGPGARRLRCAVCNRERKSRRHVADYAALRDALGKDAWNVKAAQGEERGS